MELRREWQGVVHNTLTGGRSGGAGPAPCKHNRLGVPPLGRCFYENAAEGGAVGRRLGATQGTHVVPGGGGVTRLFFFFIF